MTIAVEIYGNSAGVEAMLAAMDTALSPPALVGFLTGVVDPYLRGRAQTRFDAGGDDAVGKWVPLAPATEEIRSQLGYGAAYPINVRTGELERYITQSDGDGGINPWGASLTLPGVPPQGELAVKVEHAQRGGVSDSGKPFPARPVLGMNSKDLIFVLTALAQYVEQVGEARF